MITTCFLADGRLRHFWRAAIFFLLMMYILPWAFGPVVNRLAEAIHLQPTLNAAAIAFDEIVLFITALIPTALFAGYERRRLDSYGLPIRKALGTRTWEGAVIGFITAGLVGLGMLVLGGMRINGLASHGGTLANSILTWLAASIVIGIAEEFAFRGYLLQALWRSIGFWPAAAITTAIFVALHYFYKPGENIWDVVTLTSLALLLCYSVLRTGNLWFAVGFHVAFDYVQLFVIGTPNGGQFPVGRLFDVSFLGPNWLTGGSLGTEASVLMYPIMALLWIYAFILFRNTPDAEDARLSEERLAARQD